MTSLVERVLRLLSTSDEHRGHMLGGFADSVVQMFENCRPGLTDEALRKGPEAVEHFFQNLYDKERPRLRETIEQQEQHLSAAARAELFERVDERMRMVVVPAYVRVAARFTPRERNDFFIAPEPMRGLERLGFIVAGMGIGAFAVWAPFIPIWEKEWVLLFALAGLAFPGIRRLLSLRRYQAELNGLVTRTDNEIWRLDLAYLTDGMTQEAAGEAGETDSIAEHERLRARLDEGERAGAAAADRRRLKEGGR